MSLLPIGQIWHFLQCSIRNMNPDNIDKFIGTKVKERRKVVGLSLRELASKLGLAHNQVQKYESGKNSIGASRLLQIAAILEIDISYFFEGSGVCFGNQMADNVTNATEELLDCFSHLDPIIQQNLLKVVKQLAIEKNA